MAAELRGVAMRDDATAGVAVPVRALTRIVVPPVRLTRPDDEIGFLSFGLAEAMSGSLASLAGTVVRAPAIAAAWSATEADPRKLAAHADVDLVISSSLLRSGAQLRATVQLPDGTHLVSLQPGAIYLVRTDADGLQTLERHSWPGSLR